MRSANLRRQYALWFICPVFKIKQCRGHLFQTFRGRNPFSNSKIMINPTATLRWGIKASCPVIIDSLWNYPPPLPHLITPSNPVQFVVPSFRQWREKRWSNWISIETFISNLYGFKFCRPSSLTRWIHQIPSDHWSAYSSVVRTSMGDHQGLWPCEGWHFSPTHRYRLGDVSVGSWLKAWQMVTPNSWYNLTLENVNPYEEEKKELFCSWYFSTY